MCTILQNEYMTIYYKQVIPTNNYKRTLLYSNTPISLLLPTKISIINFNNKKYISTSQRSI